MHNFISRYSQAFALFAWGILLAATIFFGQALLGEKGEVAALAGFITILGVSANNLVQSIGHREREKAKREFEVRRDIYLELAEGIAQNWARLGSRLRVDSSDAKESTGDSSAKQPNAPQLAAAGNKVRIVGSAKTVECFEDLQKALVIFELNFAQEKKKVSTRFTEIKQLDEQFKKNQESLTQINGYLQNAKPTGLLGVWTDADRQQVQNMQQQFSGLTTGNSTLSERIKTLYREIVLAEKEYFEYYITNVTKIQPLVTDLMISIRSELDVSLDEEWYRALAGSVNQEISAEFKRIIADTHQVESLESKPVNEKKEA